MHIHVHVDGTYGEIQFQQVRCFKALQDFLYLFVLLQFYSCGKIKQTYVQVSYW